MSWIGDSIRRARHRRGFGVHSPLAFKVVKEVLWPSGDYAYYREKDITRLCPAPLQNVVLRAWRLACLQNLPLRIEGKINSELRTLLSDRLPAAADVPTLLLSLSDGNGGNPPSVPEGGILYVWHGNRSYEAPGLDGELILLLPDGYIAFSRPGTPRQCYDF